MRMAREAMCSALVVVAVGVTAACGDDDGDDVPDVDAGDEADADDGAAWEIVLEDLPGALLSVWGSARDDIWVVGGDPPDGDRPLVYHHDGTTWDEVDTGAPGDLWWVFGFAGGDVFMGGTGGRILRHDGETFTTMTTPRADVAIFGMWGCSPDDLWAVGGAVGGSSQAFAWRRDGDAWVDAEGFPAAIVDTDVIWKVYGRACDDVWLVGTGGLTLHWDGESFGEVERVGGEQLFTVHASSDGFAAVGGFPGGVVVEDDGSGWENASPGDAPPLNGVYLTEDGGGYAVGAYGGVLSRGSDGWSEEETELFLDSTLHAVWVDPDGGIWAVGGQILNTLTDGVLIHKE